MCGILFTLISSKPLTYSCSFNPFAASLNNSYVKNMPEIIKFDYVSNIFSNQLFPLDFTLNDIKHSIKPRGPDHYDHFLYDIKNNKKISLTNKDIGEEKNTDHILIESEPIFETLAKTNDSLITLAASSVLHLRGVQGQIPSMPFINETTGNILLYNGELYDISKDLLSLIEEKLFEYDHQNQIITLLQGFSRAENDTEQIFKILDLLSQLNIKADDYLHIVNLIFSSFKGDFSILFFDNSTKRIFIGKDNIGKRSLLLGIRPDGFIITSVAPKKETKKIEMGEEEEKEGDSNKEEVQETAISKKYLAEFLAGKQKEWLEINPASMTVISLNVLSNSLKIDNYPYLKNKDSLKFDKLQMDPCEFVEGILVNCVKKLLESTIEYKHIFEKNNELEKTANNEAKIAVMFSGGLDSTLIAHVINLLLPKQEK